MARLLSFRAKSLVEIQLRNGDQTVVDFGQITTIWDVDDSLSLFDSTAKDARDLPEGFVERKLNELYSSRVGRSRSSSKGLTKKQIPGCLEDIPDEATRLHADGILRKVLKVGTSLSRLVDSDMARKNLFDKRKGSMIKQQACAALCLSQDSNSSGRFKRWPTLLIDERKVGATVEELTVINGGWLVVDQSVRAGAEARKFTERSLDDSGGKGLSTASDERIARRLECLAMGEVLSGGSAEERLELDVRETLQEMKLPLTPKGAQEALTRIGRWTGDNGRIHFWPKPILDAAGAYVKMSKTRRSKGLLSREKRVDLTNIPCICVDAKRVAFRDDAIGVRPRESTGRRYSPECSKWEILLHIADVSDLFNERALSNDPSNPLSVLHNAAKSRGTSRYDLPSGPLHLLPPVVLQELSLSSKVESSRCVTLWVYVDERDGRLLDAGLERTLVAAPTELSFSQATSIMDGVSEKEDRKSQAVLLVAERSLKAWSQRRQQQSENARKREKRLVSKETHFYSENQRDDGSEGFVRTRAHRLVDASLDMYAYALSSLLRRADNAPIPRARGADAARGGRLATSPLRRFLDGQAQRQALAVCCQFGSPMTATECREAGKASNEARNAVANVRAKRKQKT